jgi:hypothetical protein
MTRLLTAYIYIYTAFLAPIIRTRSNSQACCSYLLSPSCSMAHFWPVQIMAITGLKHLHKVRIRKPIMTIFRAHLAPQPTFLACLNYGDNLLKGSTGPHHQERLQV